MIDFLLGVPGKLKTISDWLTTYWTAARAAKVDYLDAAISGRAPASTALSNATWTNGRAALLDGIIQNSVINSIQSGAFANSGALSSGDTLGAKYADITITSVNTAKSVVIISGSGYSTNPATAALAAVPAGRLTSATNLRIAIDYGGFIKVAWTVVEFK